MGVAPIKRINNNIARPLNELINSNWNKVDTRRYFYNDCYYDHNARSYVNAGNNNTTRTYTIPINGYYTIRAYYAPYGSYGKIIGKFSKGEVLTMSFGGMYITSSQRNTTTFYMGFGKNVTINGTTNDFIYALGIGGAGKRDAGGNVNVRCNNGIAVGGGGGSYGSNQWRNGYFLGTLFGYNGGTARAWGDNVKALGGGGGAGTEIINVSNNYARGYGNGGKAFVNDNEVTTPCNISNLSFNRIYSCRGQNGNNRYGGDGGTGGAGFVHPSRGDDIPSTTYAGTGLFSSGGNEVGGSARGAPMVNSYCGDIGDARWGFFEGGSKEFDIEISQWVNTYTPNKNGFDGAAGGFYGGNGGDAGCRYAQSNGTLHKGNGGTATYGFGGYGYYGGDGQLKGGDGNYCGGNGLKAGTGNIVNGTAIRHKSIVHTLPAWNKHGSSIVIIEYGISTDNY